MNTFAESALSHMSPNERWRRRHLRNQSDDDDGSPVVPKLVASAQGHLTALEERIEEHKNKIAARNYQKRLKHDLHQLQVQLADQQRPFPKSTTEFARRLKSSY